MAKRTYRSVPVNSVDRAALISRFQGGKATLAIDVAKTGLKAAVIDRADGTVVSTWSWQAPKETRAFMSLAVALSEVAEVEAALEPTGTYGDVLRGMLGAADIPVFRVSAKHSHDAAELYDGVPSQHDAKCAAVVGWLHGQGKSSRWLEAPAEHRNLIAAVDVMVMFDKQEHACVCRLEAKLARHFPELTNHLELGSATVLALLEHFGDPASIAARPVEARELMRRVGGSRLVAEKIEHVIEAARTSTGVPMTDGERAMIKVLAHETDRQRKEANAAAKHVEAQGAHIAAIGRMGEVVGKRTAAVVFSESGDPSAYAAPAAYIKALGLNLKIKNSGKPADLGRLKITKRGSPRARMYLYMAVLRLIQDEACFRAWYARKVERDGGKQKLKAVVALMRKLAAGLWHVARGAPFEPARLFDTKRLGLTV